ncbi:FIG00943694: hypothetical protein [Candidatus Synechococcus spongiarum]|uniref:Uncharacterized protein n=1 Tax=Candidatus Synechococcus spongiarum TaxID=431041 RepID=A0A165AFQ8_9SYNE|nr:FIG00943694: hypothetical protein [Candidatus Synechococcus spongiarum]
MLLVRSYRTFAPLPVPGQKPGPSAVCFCGTILTVTRTGRYPAGLAMGEPGLSSARAEQTRPCRGRLASFPSQVYGVVWLRGVQCDASVTC